MSRKQRKSEFPRIYKLTLGFSAFSMILWLFSSLFLRSYNINLSLEMQMTQQKINTMQVENDQLKVDIQQLLSRERITNIANDAGLENNGNSIITVGD